VLIVYYILVFVLGVLISFIYSRNRFHVPGAVTPDLYNEELRLKEIALNALEIEKKSASDLKDQLESLRKESTEMVAQLSNQKAIYGNLREKLEEKESDFIALHKKLQEEFEGIANKVILGNSQKIQQQHSEKLSDILSPLKDKITGFEKRVQEVNEQNIRDNQSLKEQLIQLKDLNKSIGEEARNLTSALKGQSKTQGNWGEIILESILEKSGLVKDREYFVQESFLNDEGRRLQPDVLIKLPEEKTIIIDAKVSLTAYEKFASCNDEIESKLLLKEHLNSVKKHINGLSDKEYHQIYSINTLDFVLMFVPIEPAFNVAISKDNSLFMDAYEKNIVLVSPSTLLATLMTIASIWKNEYQNQNSREIARLSGKLYDKFVGFIEDMQDIDKKLKSSQESYDKAMNKLSQGRGNIITTSEKIKKLGAGASKSISTNLLNEAEESE